MAQFTWDANGGDWTTKLAEIIQMAAPGDVIRVNDLDCVELGIRARDRMCPGKELYWETMEDRNRWPDSKP